MKLISRVINKLWYYLHKHFLKQYGFGCKVRKDVWEREFGGEAWNYLESEDEKGRYSAIIKLYKQLKPNENILDLGCGKGVLFKYLKQEAGIENEQYTGIDISETAISEATKKYPNVTFSYLDFDKHHIDKRFDIIIFNETLYYFNFPIKTLQKCCDFNLNKNGLIIISMYDGDANAFIWKEIESKFSVLKHEVIENSKHQKWNVKVIGQPVNAAIHRR